MKQFKNQGFTLIELMIVVAILAILAGIAIPAYTGYVQTAKVVEAHNNIAALRLAQEEFFLENTRYFTGATTALAQTDSQGLWTAVRGSEAAVAFNYNVTGDATTWSVIATGNLAGTSAFGVVITASRL